MLLCLKYFNSIWRHDSCMTVACRHDSCTTYLPQHVRIYSQYQYFDYTNICIGCINKRIGCIGIGARVINGGGHVLEEQMVDPLPRTISIVEALGKKPIPPKKSAKRQKIRVHECVCVRLHVCVCAHACMCQQCSRDVDELAELQLLKYCFE
jgi:hypothetical protein